MSMGPMRSCDVSDKFSCRDGTTVADFWKESSYRNGNQGVTVLDRENLIILWTSLIAQPRSAVYP